MNVQRVFHGPPRTVYGLCSSADEIVRYVGCTEKKPGWRRSQLMASARAGGHFPVHEWIRSVLSAGDEVRVVVLIPNATRWHEQTEIRRRLEAGEPLVNVEGNPAAEAERLRRRMATYWRTINARRARRQQQVAA